MKYLPSFAFFLLLLLRLTQPAYSQSSTLSFERLTEEDGLSNNNVPSILQDREGFMWFGTFYGLNKYDGYNFTVFKHDPNNPAHSVRGTGSRTIHEDKEGNLWVATSEGGGLNKIDKRTGSIITFLDHLGPNFGSLFEDRQGFLWIGSIGISGKLVRFNPKTEEYIQFTNITGSVVAEDASGRFWMLEQRRLRTFEFNRRSGKYTLNPDNLFADTTLNFTSAHMDKDGMLWIGTSNKGLFTLNTNASPMQLRPYNPSPTGSSPSDLVIRAGPSEPGRAGGRAGGPVQRGNPGGQVNQNITLNGIYEDADGYLWLATTEGLQRINKKTNEVITYRSDPAIPGTLNSNNIYSVYKDREGVLWVGTVNGINKAIAQPKPFKVHQVNVSTLAQSLPENYIRTIVEDRAGIVWLGSLQKGLYQFNPQSLQIKHIDAKPADPGSLSSEGVGIIYEDRSGRLWVSTKEALHRLDRARGKFIRYPTEGIVIAMDEEKGGKIWIGFGTPRIGEGGVTGIAYLDSATQKFRYYYRGNSDAGLNNAYGIWDIMASRTGDIWVTTGGGGINRLNPKTGKFTYYIPDYPLTAGHFNDISAFALYEDPQGIIWVGTFKSGLNRFDPKTNKFSYFTTREGLPSNQVLGIIGDTKGNLWLGTSNGISRFNPAAGSFRNFDVSDGLPDNSFNNGSVYSRNGKLLFGTRNGFVSFYPDSIKDNTTPPPVYITGLKVLEKSRPLPGGALELPYRENYLSFDFVALNYDSPEKNQYAYKMEGLDKDWIYSNARRYASYTNLTPGKYTFRVKASNNDGTWNEKGASLSIIVHPPWWRTWWAYTFYVLCFLAGLFLADRYQRQRLVQKERERTKERELAQAREIEKAYHELKTTQAQLIQSEKMASLGELTAGIAHEIQNPLNFVNNFSEVSMELIEEVKSEKLKAKSERSEELENELLDDISQNLQKISHHGKRADFIVKGMLQHSRASSSTKEPTDINKLADEYFRLAYHGLRAKDKMFNAELVTDFDTKLPLADVVPQDIGRVMLNLFTNAFYATQQRFKADKDFKPEVKLSTNKN
ncbi:MAG: two-component regulator propeller domain-containing protein, partial [Daejeonella sp.]|nr:two-component regulator propeller domain-containing protein [Daejeonella sp.]